MNGLLMLLFKLWIWRKNRVAEKVFEQQLDVDQDTVSIRWDEVFGNEAPPRHALRR